MTTSLAEIIAPTVFRLFLLLIALTAVSLLHWVLGPENPPPALPPDIGSLVLFWHIGSAAPVAGGGYLRSGCRHFVRSVASTAKEIVESPVYRLRNLQVRLVMPAICEPRPPWVGHPNLNREEGCIVSKWPSSLQRQLFGRDRVRVERRSRMLNCSSATGRRSLAEDVGKTLEHIKDHCRRHTNDLVAYAHSATPTPGSLRGVEAGGLAPQIEESMRTKVLDALLGKTGEAECLRSCFGQPSNAACGPRRHSSSFWWARCSDISAVVQTAMATQGQVRPAWRSVRSNASGAELLAPLRGAGTGSGALTTCWASKK